MSSSTWPDHRKSTGSSRTCESPLSRDSGHKCSRRRCWCVRGLLLESYCPPQVVRLFLTGCLRSSFTCVDVSHFVHFVLVLILARCIRFSGPLFLLHSSCLGDPVFVCIHPCSNVKVRFFPSTFVQQMFWFFPGIHHCGVWSLFHWMQAQHNQDNLHFDRELQCQQILRRISSVQFLEFFPQQHLTRRSRSFSICCDFLRQPHLKRCHLTWNTTQIVPIRCIPRITQCLSRPTLVSHHFLVGDTKKLLLWNHDDQERFHESYDLQMCWHLTLQLFEFRLLLQIVPSDFSTFVQFVSFRSSLPSLPMYFWPLLNDQWQTDLPPMVSAKSLQLCIRLNCCILKWFRARFLVSPQNDSKKTKILDETDKKWNTAP